MRHTKSLRGRSVCVVEVLEIRQLLSGTTSADSLSSPQNLTNTISPLIVNANLPQVNWSGSTTSLTAGQTTISHDLGTDFGYMGVGGGSVTRTYTITNNNASTLNLTGSPDLIQITGAASGDFSVTTAPAASLAPSASTTFTITFTPTAAGTRAAMITIPVGGSASGSFTFNIQGSGLTTTTSNDGLQVATTQAGSGVGAANYDGLKVNYTGYLLDGTKFDSSLNTGRTPFEFTLGVGSVITGWDEGMLGIKVGEKRVLIIPSDLAYGSSGTTGIPGNSILIFEVEALAITSPELGVTGNSASVVNNATGSLVATGTYFPNPVSPATSVTHTFSLSNVGGGSLRLTGSPYIQLSGVNAGDFSVTQPVSNSSRGADFTVTFTPTTSGIRTATITIPTNGLTTSSFTFTIQGGGQEITPATFSNGTFTINGLTNSNKDTSRVFGQVGDIAISGDWNGDGTTELGIFRNGLFILDTKGNGYVDSSDDSLN